MHALTGYHLYHLQLILSKDKDMKHDIILLIIAVVNMLCASFAVHRGDYGWATLHTLAFFFGMAIFVVIAGVK